MNTINKIQLSGVLLGVLFLSGCTPPWESNPSTKNAQDNEFLVAQEPQLTGEVLASIKGKPVITIDSLAEEKRRLLEINPQLKSMMAFMDEKQVDLNLAEGLLNQAIVDTYITTNGINQKSDYKAELQEGIKSVERMINTKYFSQAFDVAITDAEIKDFYETNKHMIQELVLSRGGVKAMAVPFTTQADAKAFADKVRLNNGDIQAAARESGMADKVKDFKLVHEHSLDVDGPLRVKILSSKSFPTIDVVKIGESSYWVFSATGKEEAKYRPLDERVKAGLQQLIQKEKREKLFEQKIEQLKKEYNVAMNDSYFGKGQAEEGSELTLEELERLAAQEELSQELLSESELPVAQL